MKINLLLEHIGMIHFLESLVDKKYNWQILLPNWLHMIPKAVNVCYNHIIDEICFLLEFCDFVLKLNTLLQSLMYICIKTILVFYIFGQLKALSDELYWEPMKYERISSENEKAFDGRTNYIKEEKTWNEHEKGKDILDIIRNLKTFTKKYIHNLNNQIFIEIVIEFTPSWLLKMISPLQAMMKLEIGFEWPMKNCCLILTLSNFTKLFPEQKYIIFLSGFTVLSLYNFFENFFIYNYISFIIWRKWYIITLYFLYIILCFWIIWNTFTRVSFVIYYFGDYLLC